MTKKIPIEWLIETLDARLNPYSESLLLGVPRQVFEDLVIMGLIDETKIDFTEIETKEDTKEDPEATNGKD